MKPFSWVQDRIREVAEDEPDRVAQCQYFDNGVPECIVGRVLAELGVRTVEVGPGTYHLMAAEGGFVAEDPTFAQHLDWRSMGVRMPGRRQRNWIEQVQALQDSGARWGDAVKEADK